MYALVCLAVALAGQSNPEPQFPSIETIRNAYLSAITPIHTLDCEMHLDFSPVKLELQPPPEVRYDNSNVHLWRKGNCRSLLIEYTDGNYERANASWLGFDGKLYATWSMSLRPVEQQNGPPGGTLQAEKANNLYEEFTIDRLTGETLSAGDLPLIDLLRTPEAKVVGRKKISGIDCLEVNFPRHMPGRKYPLLKTVETIVWLDPQQSYLPRLIQRRLYYPDPDSPRLYEFETTRFGAFMGEDHQTYTLPIAGESRNSMTHARLKLIRATINGPVADQAFQPNYPPMTEVLQTLPGQPPKRVIVGDAKK